MTPNAKSLALPIAAFAAFVAALSSYLAHSGFSATMALTIAAILLNGLVAMGDKLPFQGGEIEASALPAEAESQQTATIEIPPASASIVRLGAATLVVICVASIASLVWPAV